MFARFLLSAATLLSLGLPSAAHAAPLINVVATTTQVEDFVSHVGGDRINPLPILAGDGDPHDYQPTADDARKFAQANAVFANGLGLESWLDPLLANVPTGVPVVKLGERSGIPLLQGSGAEEESADPHVWHDPTNVQKMVATIRDTLSSVNPDGAPVYQTNADVCIAQLADLDRWISQQIQTIPPEQRKLVTNHDAFMYYVTLCMG